MTNDDAQLLLAEHEGKMHKVDGPFALHLHSMHNRPGYTGRLPDDLLCHNQKDKRADYEELKRWKAEFGF